MRRNNKETKVAGTAQVSAEREQFEWEKLPFVGEHSVWEPKKEISANSRIAADLIGAEFALAYLSLRKECGRHVGLVHLFFIAREMANGGNLNDTGGVERAFFDMIDAILLQHVVNVVSIEKMRDASRWRTLQMLVDLKYPNSWKLETLDAMAKLDELLWSQKGG